MMETNLTINGKKNTMEFLPRIAGKDAQAAGECLEFYGSFVWAIARKFTATYEDAETLTQQIFSDIWRSAAQFDAKKLCEDKFIGKIIEQHVRSFSQVH